MSSPDGLFNTPSSLRKLYSVGDTVGAAPNNKQAVTGFLGQHFKQSDLSEFNTLFFSKGKSYVSAHMTPKGDSPTGLLSGVEAMLDGKTSRERPRGCARCCRQRTHAAPLSHAVFARVRALCRSSSRVHHLAGRQRLV
jgi:hypothetical protein